MERKTQVKAHEGRQDLVITREFDLPVELLFKAHTDPALLSQWMGTRVIKFEGRKHGSYQLETSHNGAVVFRANGTFHEVVPDRQIIRTFEMENMPIGVQLEFLEFEGLSDSTSKLTMQIIFKSSEHRAEQLKMPFSQGINYAHNRLQELFNKN